MPNYIMLHGKESLCCYSPYCKGGHSQENWIHKISCERHCINVFALLVQNSSRNIICLHYAATKLSWPMVEMAICAAFVSISQSLPVFDTMTAHSGVTSGRYKSAFSCEENKTTLQP